MRYWNAADGPIQLHRSGCVRGHDLRLRHPLAVFSRILELGACHRFSRERVNTSNSGSHIFEIDWGPGNSSRWCHRAQSLAWAQPRADQLPELHFASVTLGPSPTNSGRDRLGSWRHRLTEAIPEEGATQFHTHFLLVPGSQVFLEPPPRVHSQSLSFMISVMVPKQSCIKLTSVLGLWRFWN